MKPEGHYFRKMARGGLIALLGRAITYPVGLILAVILARLLTPQELGGYFLGMSLILFTAILVQFGTGPVMVKFVAAALAAGDHGRARRTLTLGFGWLAVASPIAIATMHSEFGVWLLESLKEASTLRGMTLWIGLLAVAYATISFSCEVLRSFSDLARASLFAEQLLQRLLLLVGLIVAWSGNI
jgi:O-antigen/teichoic acid export membrane protein